MATREWKFFGFILLGTLFLGFVWFGDPSEVDVRSRDGHSKLSDGGLHSLPAGRRSHQKQEAQPSRSDSPMRLPNLRERESNLQRMVGWVTDPELRGIGAAELIIHTSDVAYPRVPIICDSEGFFRIPAPRHLPFVAEVSAPGFQTARVSLPLKGISESNTIILKPGGVLEVLVRDEDRRPIVGAHISTNSVPSSVTDAEGTSRLRGLSFPAYLWIKAPGYNDQRKTVHQEISSLEVILKADAVLRGKVVHVDSHSPIAQFRVQLQDATGKSLVYDLREDDGYFEIPELPRDILQIRVVSKNLQPAVQFTPAGLPAGKSPIYVFELSSQGLFFGGNVINSKGTGLTGAEVTAYVGKREDPTPTKRILFGVDSREPYQVNLGPWLAAAFETTESEGHFNVGPLPVDARILLVARHPDYASASLDQAEMLLEKDQTQIVLTLEDYASVHGTAGQSDQPVPRKITLLDGQQIQQEILLHPNEETFAFSKVHAGSIRVTLQASTGDHQATGRVPNVVPDETSFELEPGASREISLGHDPKLRMAGHVYLDRIPMANSLVVVIREKTPKRIYKTQTNAEGYFSLYPLAEGTYQVMANGTLDDEIFGVKNRETIALDKDSLDLHFEFGSMGKVLGRVPVSWESRVLTLEVDYPIAPRTQARSGKTALVQQGGFFQFERVPPGIFQISAQPPHHFLVIDETMPDDGSDLDLGDLGESEGELVISLHAPHDFGGEGVSFHLTETHRGASSRHLVARVSSATSPSRIQGLSPGQQWLEASAINPGFWVKPQRLLLEIHEGEEAEAQFELIPITTLSLGKGTMDSVHRFHRANLFQEETQQNWQIPVSSAFSPAPTGSQEPQMTLQPEAFYAQGLPSGWWQLRMETTTMMAVTRRFQLVEGRPINLVVNQDELQRITFQKEIPANTP